jgi:nucleotide-binding universal stress UspA family protein
MPKRVLVPIDGSDQAWRALDHALDQFESETITVLTIVDPLEGMYTDLEGGYYTHETYEQAVEAGEQRCEEARRRAQESGRMAETVLETAVEVGRPSQEILAYVENEDIDHVVMGSHGRSGVSRILFGSVAETVTRRAPVPVTIVR